MSRPTIKDVAAMADVSTATVSYVLNGTGSVSEATALRVRECVDKLGYRANSLAIAHRTGRSRTIGLALPDLTNPFHSEFAQGVHGAATERGFAVFLLDGHNDSEEQVRGIEMVSDRVPEGLIFSPVRDETVGQLDFSYPVVIVDHWEPGFDSVSADIEGGGRMQAELVAEYGHRCVGLLSGPSWSGTAQLRRKGFLEALPRDVEVAWNFNIEFEMHIPDDVAEAILASDVTCVVAANDLQALGVLHVYRKAGLSVPDDVSVIGFDDIGFAKLVSPSLTTIRLPQHELGYRSFTVLAARLDDPTAAPRREVLDVGITRRESLRSIG